MPNDSLQNYLHLHLLTIKLKPFYGILLAFFIFKEIENRSFQFYYGAFVILSAVIMNGILKNIKKRKRHSTLGNFTK